jgi:DNA-binding CsgD family transcriptional regulator/tetratricopeptide (TPR) repeat protein
VGAGDELRRGRESYARRAWTDAHRSLSLSDARAPLGAEDLERLATAAYMLGRDDEQVDALERAHQAHLDAGDALRAVRCAFWLGIGLMLRGQLGRATGWLGRAQRLLDRETGDNVERGYLLVPVMIQETEAGDYDAAFATAAGAAALGERFGEADLVALAVHQQGGILVRRGRVEEGLGLLDEAMVAVTTGQLSPIVTGLIYCSVIDGCQQVYALRRAQEWTAALSTWCEQQPDIVAFTGRCLVHRAEILQLRGAWRDALEEARRAGERCAQTTNAVAAAQASYRQAEVHRLRGELAEAEAAYRDASRRGWEPQPGLALLRLAQGNERAAVAALRRAVAETNEPLSRAGLLPAYVAVMLEVGDLEQARTACRELEEVAAGNPSEMLGAMVAQARGAVELAGGDAAGALADLRRAAQVWHELEAPYEAARARVLVALACRALGDHDTAALELEAARGAFVELGAAPDIARLDGLASGAPDDAHGLTARELEVLRLVAAGETNKTIAAALVLSERTVDRHVSNIFAKLRLSSRSAATAYAYEHRLV